MVRIGKDPMDECHRVGAVLLRDIFQALHKGRLRATCPIRGEESARKTIDGLRDRSRAVSNKTQQLPSLPCGLRLGLKRAGAIQAWNVVVDMG